MGSGWLQSLHNSSSLLLLPLQAFPLLCESFHGLQSFRKSMLQHRPQFLHEISTCSGMGFSMGCSVGICSSVVLSTCCREISVLAAGPPPLPFVLWPWCSLCCFLLFFSLLISLLDVLTFLKYIFTEVPPTTLMGSAVSCGVSIMEPAELSLCPAQGSSWSLLTEAAPAAPCYQNFATYTQYLPRINIVYQLAEMKWALILSSWTSGKASEDYTVVLLWLLGCIRTFSV